MKKRIAVCLIVALVLTGIAATGVLDTVDNTVNDYLYQSASATDGEIVVVGMDQYALEEIGPLPWDRSIMAQILNILNADEENRPAAIGIDVLYVGQTDTEEDEALVEAVENSGNIVLAAAATFGTDTVVKEDGEFYLDNFSVQAMDEPMQALIDAGAGIGHINAMFDNDGVMRHALAYVDWDGNRIDSFNRSIYLTYCKNTGQTPNPVPPTDSKGFWYLDYTTTNGGYYDGISAADILDGTVDPSYFADKIVLIGPYAAGMQDDYPTAVEHAQKMYGVEIQANAIDAQRTGSYKQEFSNVVQLLVLFLVSFLCLLWAWDRSALFSTIVYLLVMVGSIAICILSYRTFGTILHSLWIPLAATILFVFSITYNYIKSAKERRRIVSTFGHYVDPSVMKELLREGSDSLELGGKLTEITVLFVDVRGFTSMSEHLPPQQVVEILNEYLSLTTECIMRNHGTLDKFVGDCTMAIWNAPLPQEDHVYNACRAALDMVEGAKELSRKINEKYGNAVSFGIGINTGKAVVGNIGAEMRMDFTAIGDTVNTAARLESNAPGGTVYISRAVADAINDRARVTSLGDTIKLKGKSESIEVLRLEELISD